jgi:hypothetical protein
MSDEDDLTGFLEPVSPELVLVAPELRERAIAALPPVELDLRRPLPPRTAAIAPAPAPGQTPFRSVLIGAASIGAVAFVVCTLVVLTLTEVADALR